MNRITTKKVIDIQSGDVLHEEWYFDFGPVDSLKGATAAQEDLQASQSAFYKLLTQDYAIQFAKQTAILDALTKSAMPILAKGPNQEGFSAAEKNTFMTQVKDSNATAYDQEKKAVREQEAAAGGGNEYLPSGVNAQIEGQLASSTLANETNQELAVTQADYALGHQEYLEAGNMLAGVGNQINPLGYAGSSNQAGAAAGETANQIQQADAAASPWGAIGGLVGGGAAAFLGGYGSALGNKSGCWVAAALYGEDSPEFFAARRYIFEIWTGKIARFVQKIYLQFGERLAEKVKKYRVLRILLKPFFDEAVRRGRK